MLQTHVCFVVFVFVYSIKPRDWLGTMSPKWPILCRMERKTFTQSSSHFVFLSSWSVIL